MLFACCHPALAVEARIPLTLRAVVGMTTPQIARAFLVPEPTMAQRLVRAKRKITTSGIPFGVPEGDQLPTRLDDVLTVIAIAYNAGYLEPDGTDLADDAIWLAELVVRELPLEPEAWGLLALLTFLSSRATARFGADGRLLVLAEQDRSRWDTVAVARADGYLARAAAIRRPGRFQLQAAIAGCHASAPTAADTDWLEILILYDMLGRFDPSPVVRLNRAVALAEVAGPAVALADVDQLADAALRLPPVPRHPGGAADPAGRHVCGSRRERAGARPHRQSGRAAAAAHPVAGLSKRSAQNAPQVAIAESATPGRADRELRRTPRAADRAARVARPAACAASPSAADCRTRQRWPRMPRNSGRHRAC